MLPRWGVVCVGRQAVTWGNGLIFNPMDLFNPFSPVDIERDYKDFNEIRTQFYREMGLDPLPASTGIQARLCREDLLVEIEAFAFIPNGSKG